MKRGTRGEARLRVEASPETLYGLVTDVRRMAEWSPECRHCEWVDGATGPAVGARFKGTNRRGLVRWTTTLEVLTTQEGREFSFATFMKDHHESRWTYRFEPTAGGTTVTESFEILADVPRHLVLVERWVIGIKDRRADLEAGMRETLRRLKQTVEGTANSTPSTPARKADQ